MRQSKILYVDCHTDSGIGWYRLKGMRRYAAAHGWRVETLRHDTCTPESLRVALADIQPVGCVAECWCRETALPPARFGRTPVVYFEPPDDDPKWHGAHGVVSDGAAVAQMAYRELSAGRPSSYAAVSCRAFGRWAKERIDAFRECCRKDGFDCRVSHLRSLRQEEFGTVPESWVSWAAALPPRCAVFAVNDDSANLAARAMSAAGRPFPRSATLVGADGAEPAPNDRDVAETVSSVRLDFEQSGYVAARMIGEMAEVRGARRTARHRNTETFPPLVVDRRKSTRGFGRREPYILEAMEIIRREACEGLTVASLAARFPGSIQLFDLRFREAAGHSALDEIMNVRLARAIELLANTDMPISSLSGFCGFKTEWAFWRTFSRRMGVPPLRFRKDRKKP